MKLLTLISLIIIIVIINFSCSEDNDKVENMDNRDEFVLNVFDINKLKNASELNSNVQVKHFSNFKIVYFEKNELKLYLELDSQPGEYYYTSCSIDSVLEMNLLNLEKPEQIYLGKFTFISDLYGDFTFMSLNAFENNSGKFHNIFNDYYILENSSSLDIALCENFINKKNNALFASYSDGAGNYLDFRIYGSDKGEFQQLFEPKTPLENGIFAIDSGSIFLLEGIIVSKIYYQNGKIHQELLQETPIFNNNENDRTLNLNMDKFGNYSFPRFIVLNSASSLHIFSKESNVRIENNLRINFNSDFFEQNFTTFIPKKTGMTSLEFLNSDNVVIGKVRVIIN